jgi:hypothetical protein
MCTVDCVTFRASIIAHVTCDSGAKGSGELNYQTSCTHIWLAETSVKRSIRTTGMNSGLGVPFITEVFANFRRGAIASRIGIGNDGAIYALVWFASSACK